MSDAEIHENDDNLELANKIARLVEERGWNQEEFAKRADLNRQTIRQILQGGGRTLRNSTISACAKALGLPVSDLRNRNLHDLLPRMQEVQPTAIPVKAVVNQNVPVGKPSPPPKPVFSSPTLFHPKVDEDRLKVFLGRVVQPELKAWIERNRPRASELSDDEMEELLSLQQESGGVFASFGVEHFVQTIERKRALIEKVHIISNTEWIEYLETTINLVYEKIQPYRDRV